MPRPSTEKLRSQFRSTNQKWWYLSQTTGVGSVLSTWPGFSNHFSAQSSIWEPVWVFGWLARSQRDMMAALRPNREPRVRITELHFASRWAALVKRTPSQRPRLDSPDRVGLLRFPFEVASKILCGGNEVRIFLNPGTKHGGRMRLQARSDRGSP